MHHNGERSPEFPTSGSITSVLERHCIHVVPFRLGDGQEGTSIILHVSPRKATYHPTTRPWISHRTVIQSAALLQPLTSRVGSAFRVVGVSIQYGGGS